MKNENDENASTTIIWPDKPCPEKELIYSDEELSRLAEQPSLYLSTPDTTNDPEVD